MGERYAADSLPQGHLIGGRYRIVRPLGEGGVATVYEAENTWTTRRVALKILDRSGDPDDVAAARFRLEAIAAARLSHPHIVDVLDMGEDHDVGALYLVQELLDGHDLRAHLDAVGPMAPGDAIDVMLPIVGALEAAHVRGVIHRDIKPENLFLSRGHGGALVPKVIDFGLALLRSNAAPTRLTAEGTTLGTVYYMSPEQCRGDSELDGRADVWAVGAVLFEMLSGAPPFDAPTYNLLVHRILSEAAPRVDAVAPGVPCALSDVVARALARDVEERTPDMRTLLEELRMCSHLPGVARGDGLPEQHRAITAPGAFTFGARREGPSTRIEMALAETRPRAAVTTRRALAAWLGVGLAAALVYAWWLRASPTAAPRADAQAAPTSARSSRARALSEMPARAVPDSYTAPGRVEADASAVRVIDASQPSRARVPEARGRRPPFAPPARRAIRREDLLVPLDESVR